MTGRLPPVLARRVVPAVLVLLAACSLWRSDPEGVARAFWDASHRGDTAQAREHVSASSRLRLTGGPAETIEDVRLAETDIEGDRAAVRTLVRLRADHGPVEVAFRTHLVREEGAWKVDLDRTIGAFVGAALGATIRDAASGVSRAAGAAVRGAVEGFVEGVRPLSDSLVARDTAR